MTCIFLNCTKRTTAEDVIAEFFVRYPDAESYISAYENDCFTVKDVIKRLGFMNRRSKLIYDFSCDFIDECAAQETSSPDIANCRGIGEYARTCDEIFFKQEFSETPPRDSALVKVWTWIIRGQQENAFGNQN